MSAAPKKLSGLGRGLGALIPQRAPAAHEPSKAGEAKDEPAKVVSKEKGGASESAVEAVAAALDSAAKQESQSGGVLQVPVGSIAVNPNQPRVQFKHQELEDLMNSIKEHGLMQPLTVSMRPGGGYELIAGERRFRACKMLGMQTVPAMVRVADNTEKLVLALIENIQREDLNPLEEARAYGRLLNEFRMTQEMVARQVGKARSTVANMVRLLGLPNEIQEAISAGIVPAGSARAMLSLPTESDQLAFFKKMVSGGMSTREAEAGVRKSGGATRKDPAVLAAEEELRAKFGTKVEIKNKKGKGSIVLAFSSDEDFRELLRKLRE